MLKNRRRNGLTGLGMIMILLTGCVSLPSGERIKPTYNNTFLNCIAQERVAEFYGACTKVAMNDWLVMIE